MSSQCPLSRPSLLGLDPFDSGQDWRHIQGKAADLALVLSAVLSLSLALSSVEVKGRVEGTPLEPFRMD
jgi:hypothetical protein